MAVDKSRSPYFDDFDESKNFHEILFVPSRAVQVRELNQIQSMFQTQVSRFGDHVFQDGSMVIPGETNYDLDLNYVAVTIPNLANITDLLSTTADIELRASNGTTASVKLFRLPEDGDPATFYLSYEDATEESEEIRFEDGATLELLVNNEIVSQPVVLETGLASKFTINDGVYYIGGRFVLVPQQTVLLDKYNNEPSASVCLMYEERVITESQDTSLFDNAQGSPNFTAPGAHRIRVDTSLRVFDIEDLEDLPENAVEIFRIINGEIQLRRADIQYNFLNDVLAQRTYEQSGDFTVKSFPISYEEHETDKDKYNLNLGRGLAYVNGYRIETVATTSIETNKARERGIENNSSISAELGYYILAEDLNILPNVNELQEVTFYDAEVTTPGVEPSGDALGTARVRFVRRDGGDYRLYLFNVRDVSGSRSTAFISDALSVYSSVGTNFSANLVVSELINPSNNSLVFNLPVEFVATLRDSLGNSDTSYASVKQISSTTDSNGQLTVTAAPNEVFVAQDPTFAFATFTDGNEFIEVAGNFTLSGSPVGSIITLDFGVGNAGRPIRANLQVAKQEVQQKVKTVTTTSISGSLDGDNRLYLGKADAFELVSVTDDNDDDVTQQFTLVENKTRSYYDVSYVQTSASVAEPITVEFRYFAHSAGDYFGVDSYADLDYADIPTESGVRLSDVLDFRPRINDAGTGFTGAGATVGNIPTPFSIIRADVDHYLPRKDKVFVTRDGAFLVRQGVPSLNPKLPEDPSNAMVIYELDVPAYTFDLGDIQAKKISNRRYTMKDIGKLEDRIANIEYYVTLNMLEQDAEARDIIDPVTGLNRFKNGFLTDAFVDHSVGDFAWDGYHVSMSDAGELRPEFSLYATDLVFNEAESSNVVERGGVVTLPFSEESYIRQNQRSTTINVNPYAVYRWVSDIKLQPSIDSWIDTVYTDPDVTYRVFNNGRLTQTWNSWQVNWTGGTTSTTRSSDQQSNASRLRSAGIEIRGSWMYRGVIRTTTTTTTRTNVDIVADKVVDTSVIPYMRTINVSVSGEGNRPKARMHFFFDGVNVNQWVRPANSSTFGAAVRCNDDGEFSAVFRIPNNNERRFRTGDKVMVVTDEPNNITERATSYGEALFTSSGVLNTRQQTIIATRQTTTTTSVRYIHRDPIAQSFVVERAGGAFVTKINVFFSTKDEKVPVAIELREMENGIPTQRVIPGGIKQLKPADVNTSSDGSVPTTFEFDYPVHLLENNEYCFVLISNSNLYNAHIATMGQRDRGTNNYIVEQPYSGVMFKSQNNSTWTEDQNSDIQFEIFAAQFDTNVVGTVVLENSELEDIQLDANPFETQSGSNEVIVDRFMHNYIVGGTVEVTGAVGGNGIPTEDLNGIHDIVEILSPHRFVIEVDALADADGFVGGNEVYISDTIQASVINPNIRYVELPDTGIEYYARGTSGQSIDGNETPYAPFNNFVEITNGETNELPSPWMVTNRREEQALMSNQRSLRVEAIMASLNPNVSPVIDLEGSNVIMPFALVTYPEVDEVDGSNNHVNYRTRPTGIRNPANSIRLFFDALRPADTDILVSVRTGNSNEELEDASWQLLDGLAVDITGDGTEYRENEYALEEMNEFTLYQIMIQVKSRSAARFPILRRLRVIALGT